MKKIILLILFTTEICFSQTKKEVLIKGTVISSVNNQPFDYGVYLFFQNKHKGTITNDKGEFEYFYALNEKDSLETIKFSTIGYNTKNVKVDLRNSNLSNLKIFLNPRHNIDKEKAIQDLKRGEVNILLSSGIAPVAYKSDQKFMEKYNVNFIEYGCEAIAEESLLEYHKVIFEYLDSKYGQKWRRKIRPDIVGLNNDE